MGNTAQDPMAVVSYRSLKVKGIQNLRVVDASIMPNVPSKLMKISLMLEK